MDDEEATARLLWQQFAALITERGWRLAVGCGSVSICIPGNGGPTSDRYVEVADG